MYNPFVYIIRRIREIFNIGNARLNAKRRIYIASNIDKVRSQKRKWEKDNHLKEYARQRSWTKKHANHVKKYQRKYRLAHMEDFRANYHKWYIKNKKEKANAGN